MADPQQLINTLFELADQFYDRLELCHYKCDSDQDGECYAEQYGDGTAEDHSLMREIKALSDNRPQT